jgi:signal transduction histidine kinase
MVNLKHPERSSSREFATKSGPAIPIGPAPLVGLLAMPVGIALVLMIDAFLFNIPNQPGVLICFIAAAGFYGGLRVALISTAIFLIFTLWFFSGTNIGPFPTYFSLKISDSFDLEYTKPSFNRIVVFMVVAPVVATVVGHLRARLQEETEKAQRAIAELKKSNAELELFANISAHDLQEPLRAISGCVEILEKRYQSSLDANTAELMRHTVEGVSRMHGLINDLLAYTRASKLQPRRVETSLYSLLANAQQNLETAIVESGAVITNGDLPTVECDRLHCTLLLQNLLSNSIKFRGSKSPVIHISAERQPGQWVISVRDNGIGIDKMHFERIFTLFKRLHTRDVYPGTGLGLSICQKIVEAHGGNIWLESTLGQGTTFFFTLPDQLQVKE